MSEDFEYDVAFSFLAEDEDLARALSDMLQDRHRVFIYSRAQEKLAGRDGEERFNKIFAEQARLVVVLHRERWGQTPFTRIEETAIKNRAFEEGYDFTLFLPTNEPPTLPKYVPRTRLYGNLTRFGVPGVAGAISALIIERGGEDRQETVADRTERLQRAIRFQERREQFFRSAEDGREVEAAAKRAIDFVEAWAQSGEASPLQLQRHRNNLSLLLVFPLPNSAPSFVLGWRQQYVNDLANARLELQFWDGVPPWKNLIRFHEVDHPRKTLKYMPDLTLTGELIWIDEENHEHQFPDGEAGEHLCRLIMDGIDKVSVRKRPK